MGRRDDVVAWSSQHHERLLTALALPLLILLASPGGHAHTGVDFAFVGVTWLALTLRTRWPVPVALTVVALDTVHIIVAGHATHSGGTLPAASMLAIYTVGTRCSARITWAIGIAAAAAQFITALLALSHRPGPDLLYLNWALVSAVVGRLIRERAERISAAEARAEQAEQSKAAEARRQVIEERMRIARELHDVLAHHITVVNAQAGVAQYLLKSNPDAAEQALAGVADNTRAALNELRATLGLLRSDDTSTGTGTGTGTGTEPSAEADALSSRTPVPGTEHLAQLIERFTATGIAINTHTDGTAYPLPAAGDLALYRIVQEALTNAAKHAPGSRIEVSIDWASDGVVVAVANSASPPAAVPPSSPGPNTGRGTGHGLLGMRERAAAAGGTVTAEPSIDGWVVLLRLPRQARSVPAEVRT